MRGLSTSIMHLRLMNSFSSAKSSPPHNVDSNETLTLNVDNFIGGLLLYFWLLHEGEQWIRAIMKRSLKVTIDYIYSNVEILLLHKRRCCDTSKYAAKVFFGCFVATSLRNFRRIFYVVGVPKHPKNTFAACFRTCWGATVGSPSKKVENVRQKYFLDVLTHSLLFHFGRLDC